MPEDINQNPHLKLKKLAGVDTLSAAQINDILQKSILWINNFYNEAAGNKKVKGNFAIEGFNYGGEFDLSTAKDIENGTVPIDGKEPFLFLSDLVNFVEQIRTSLTNNNISINATQREELDRLGNTFALIGIYPTEEKITLEDLQKIENYEYSRRIVERIQLIFVILKPSLQVEGEPVQEEKTAQAVSETIQAAGIGVPGPNSKEKPTNQESEAGDPKQEPPKQAPHLKISELDPQAKLYLQSLSIITINQALSRYFNETSLAKIGLPPGTVITFDQLPLGIRQQLMDRAFSQVENLLLGGQFSLDKLISEPAQRINFSSQTALSLLMDVHSLNLLNVAVKDIAQIGQAQIEKNEKEELVAQQLGPRANNESTEENILTSQAAEELLTTQQSQPDFAKIIESELNIIQDENYLEQAFLEKLIKITKAQDRSRMSLVVENVRPLIEVFIQQGLPPEFLIPDARNFDYNRFVNLFGNSLDRQDFDAHREELANLIIFYWKRKRAIYINLVGRELGLEKYTPEQAQQLFEEIKKDPQKLAALRKLGVLNLNQGGRQITEQLAGLVNPDSREVLLFQKQQQALLENYLLAEISQLSKTEQQTTLKIFFDYYTPGTAYQEYNLTIFQEQIIPQINPMDFYMLQMAEQFGEGAFSADGSGYVQKAFAPGENYQGTDFLDSALGQKGKKLASKALGEGLYLALDAAGGLGEALRAAETALPIIKKIKEQLIEMGLEKILEWLKKHWPLIVLGLILAALSALLPWLLLLAPGYLLLRNGLSLGKGLLGATGKTLGRTGNVGGGVLQKNVLAQQQAAAQLPHGAKTLLGQHYSSAMMTAGRAVLTTFGLTSAIIFIYQTSLNSAFLTDFPFSESEINHSIEKTSKYAEMKKTAKIIQGCLNSENNGTKCENPSFPLTIEYTVTIKPKEDFALQISKIEDQIKFKQSKKGWEESGKPMPTIPTEKNLDFAYFKKIIAAEQPLAPNPLNSSAPSFTPSPSYIPANNNDPQANPSVAESEFIVIPAGESLTFTYTLDKLSSDYNHTAIINTIEVDFYYQNAIISGKDNLKTAARVCLGNCSAGAGCWPTTGTIWQLPFGDYSHSPPNAGGYGDSYDIGCNNCSGAAIYGPPVHARFDGNLCFVRCDNHQYGCRYILEFQNEGQTYYEDYAHFQEPNPALNIENTCMPVEAGFLIGLMSNRGMGSVHLHFGLVNGASGMWWGSKPAFSMTEQLVPETDNGRHPAAIGDPVSTCYEQ